MLKASFCLALLLIVLVVISINTNELPAIDNSPAKQEADKTTESKENTKTQNQNSTAPLTITNPTPPPPLQDNKETENTQYSNKQKSSWWDFSLTDALLAIFTFGLVIVGGIQCYIIFNTLKETQIAAKAATESTQVAVIAMEHTQRAYIYIKEFIHTVKQVEGFGEIIIVLENTGETPVKNLIANFDYCVFSGEIPKDFDFPEKGPRQYGVMGRKATLDARVLMPFNVFEDARTKKQRLYIYGWVDYDDVFPNTPRHRTESCHEVIISKDRKFTYNIYGNHNGSDDECYRKPSPYVPQT